jgi:hypothetical protein
MRQRNPKPLWRACVLIGLLVLGPGNSHAEIRLASDWQSYYKPDGSRIPDEQREGWRLDNATKLSILSRSAIPFVHTTGSYRLDLGFKLRLDGTLFYLQPAMFMRKSRPDEVCNPNYRDGAPSYACLEGQRHTKGCHLFFFNQDFAEVGYHEIEMKESYPYYCNTVAAISVANKANNEMFVTVQYFPIDRKLAGKASELGAGWKRITLLVRIKQDNGKIVIEQDDSCLGNPNNLEDIASARKALLACRR